MTTLIDTGPLVALRDPAEPAHAISRSTLDSVSLPLLTTWPVFTEAMHLLGRSGGWRSQRELWRLAEDGHLVVETPSAEAVARSAKLMGKYADRPMDLADATLVALAEERGLRRIFTLDEDFHVYRLNGRRAFEIVPRRPTTDLG